MLRSATNIFLLYFKRQSLNMRFFCLYSKLCVRCAKYFRQIRTPKFFQESFSSFYILLQMLKKIFEKKCFLYTFYTSNKYLYNISFDVGRKGAEGDRGENCVKTKEIERIENSLLEIEKNESKLHG